MTKLILHKKSYFDNNIKGRNNIDYVAFLVELQKANLTYFVDEVKLLFQISSVPTCITLINS